jgi:hypothetical protein
VLQKMTGFIDRPAVVGLGMDWFKVLHKAQLSRVSRTART